MKDPQPLAATVAAMTWPERIKRAMAIAHARNQARRTAVLKHPDLAARLCQPPLDYKRPDQWNGYVPPETCDGEHNDSPQRAALIEISAEAWDREHRPDDAAGVQPPTADLPDLLPENDQPPALPAGAAGPASLLDPGGQLNGHT